MLAKASRISPAALSCTPPPFSALATVMALPNRQKLEGNDVDTNPHNIPFVALGTGLLWFGWFGFNGGSALPPTVPPSSRR